MSTIRISSLLDSLKRDDADTVTRLLSTDADSFRLATAIWGENPVVVALKHGSSRVAQMIAWQFKEFAAGRTKDGRRTALHLASKMGNLHLVQLLLRIDPRLCLETDWKGMLPLHTAIKSGHLDEIRAFIGACPESVKQTLKKKTVFHFALKHNQYAAFTILTEEIKKLNMEHLLRRKDGRGNTVLHIATSKKLPEVVRLLLPPSSGAGALVEVNSLNKKGLTALDICHRKHGGDIATHDIGNILLDAGAVEGSLLPAMSQLKSSLDTKNVILVDLAIVVGAALTAVFNLPASLTTYKLAQDEVFSATDVMYGQLPVVFYYMVFNLIVVMVGMVAINVLSWSLPFRPIVLFVSVATIIAHALILHCEMPEFFVHGISSSVWVGFVSAAVVIAAAMAYYLVKYVWLRCASCFGAAPASSM